jgi:hypothetical protein
MNATHADDGLIAHWDFADGRGNVAHDRSGNNHHARLHGPKWIADGDYTAIAFDGRDDYVDCGAASAFKLAGPYSLCVWVKHEQIGGWQNYIGNYVGGVSGYVIAQNGGRLHFHNGGTLPHVLNSEYPPVAPDTWRHVAAVYDGGSMRIYMDGLPVATQNVDGQSTPSAEQNLRLGSYHAGSEYFHGLMDDVRIYNRALSPQQIARLYGSDPRAAQQTARSLILEPFFYPSRDEAVAAVNFRHVLPLGEGVTIETQIAKAGNDQPLASSALDPDAPAYEDEAAFSLAGYEPGAYELRAVLKSGPDGDKIERFAFTYPFPFPAPPADPQRQTAGELSPIGAPLPDYRVQVQRGGGFTVAVGKRRYKIESSYSYPYGGENRLVAADPDRNGESSWRVDATRTDPNHYRVTAAGAHYSIDRDIAIEPTRVLVKDTIRNTSDDVVGIMLSNALNASDLDDAQSTMLNALTAFIHAGEGGVGLIALDDLYQLQLYRRFENGVAELRTDNFGLAPGDQYTIEWAVYPTASNDYYDFINRVRDDEGLNGGRVEGTWKGASIGNLPSPEEVDLFKIRYLSLGTPWHPIDDPTLSIEGFEFMQYPQECERVRQFVEQAKALHPDMHVMIHIAHGLYTTNKPHELFGDSLVIKADGNTISYGNGDPAYYRRYFSEQRVRDGYRWFIFYPTMENSFGKEMLRGMQFMVDQMGVTGMWADGFVSGYARVGGNSEGYSYDRWDGRSVDIDPTTKLVTRKKTNVSWASLPVLVESVRIIDRGGGITLTNSGRNAGSRALWTENIISSCEGSRDAVLALHLGRAAASLSSPAPTARASYRDILAKLDLGSLYFWYRHSMDHKTLVEHMYPITIESIYPGVIRGKERIVTKESGVYGWPSDTSLHAVYLYDARGYLAPGAFLSTVDQAGTRTELQLGKDESAAVARLPITLTANRPVNATVHHYGEDAIRIALNGSGRATITFDPAAFQTGAHYRVEPGDDVDFVADGNSPLVVPLTLDGPTMLTVIRQ